MTLFKEEEMLELSESEQTKLENSLTQLFIDSFNRAAKAFSQLLLQEMVISRYKIELISGEQFINQLENQMESGYFASIIKLQNDMDATIVFLLTEEEGKKLYNILNDVKQNTDCPHLEDMIDSIGELNNILGSNFINCLANMLNQTIPTSVPSNTLDLLGAILESIILQNEYVNKNIFFAEAEISDKDRNTFSVKLIILSDKIQLMKLLSQ